VFRFEGFSSTLLEMKAMSSAYVWAVDFNGGESKSFIKMSNKVDAKMKPYGRPTVTG